MPAESDDRELCFLAIEAAVDVVNEHDAVEGVDAGVSAPSRLIEEGAEAEGVVMTNLEAAKLVRLAEALVFLGYLLTRDGSHQIQGEEEKTLLDRVELSPHSGKAADRAMRMGALRPRPGRGTSANEDKA